MSKRIYDDYPCYEKLFNAFHATRNTKTVHLDPQLVWNILRAMESMYDKSN